MIKLRRQIVIKGQCRFTPLEVIANVIVSASFCSINPLFCKWILDDWTHSTERQELWVKSGSAARMLIQFLRIMTLTFLKASSSKSPAWPFFLQDFRGAGAKRGEKRTTSTSADWTAPSRCGIHSSAEHSQSKPFSSLSAKRSHLGGPFHLQQSDCSTDHLSFGTCFYPKCPEVPQVFTIFWSVGAPREMKPFAPAASAPSWISGRRNVCDMDNTLTVRLFNGIS